MENYTVYKLTFPDGKIYIGQTSLPVEQRWKNGEGYKGQNVYVPITLNGWDNIKKEILHTNLTKELALAIEQYYIHKFHSVKNGYNIKQVSEKEVIKTLPAEFKINILTQEIMQKLSNIDFNSSTRLLTFSELRKLAKIAQETEVIFEWNGAGSFITTVKEAAESQDVYLGGCGHYTFLFLSDWRVWIGDPSLKFTLKTPWLDLKDVKEYNSAFITDWKAKEFYLKNREFPASFNEGFEKY